jgi:hypothetical protein
VKYKAPHIVFAQVARKIDDNIVKTTALEKAVGALKVSGGLPKRCQFSFFWEWRTQKLMAVVVLPGFRAEFRLFKARLNA